MKLITILLCSVFVAGSLPAPSAAQAARPGASKTAETHVSAKQVLANVRRAVGYNAIRAFAPGFAIVEREDNGEANELHFGTRRGELRRRDEFWFDGVHGWQFDNRRNMAVPSSLRQREKSAWPLWVRGHWWLSPTSGFTAKVVPGASNAREVALALSLPGGVAGATVYIERATWLPQRIVVPYERGPFTERYSDYRSVRGVMFPFSVESTYRDTSARRVVSVRPLRGLSTFMRPPVPAEHRFDPNRPATLETREGAPFGPGSPGHVYVRATLNDSRIGWWHFDSGADSMVVDEAVANDLGMEVIGTHRSMGADGNVTEGTWRRAKSFQVGRIRIENVVFRAWDLSKNNAPPGERRMGTVGYDLFARSVVEYADGGRRVRICDPSTYRLPAEARWQRLDHIDSTPAATGVADGLTGLFQLDTGSAGSIDFTKHFHEKHRMLESRTTQQLKVQGSGGAFAVQVGKLKQFSLGGELFRDLEVAFRTGGISREGSAGTVGREVLGRFTMVFDYPRQRLAFMPKSKSGFCG